MCERMLVNVCGSGVCERVLVNECVGVVCVNEC